MPLDVWLVSTKVSSDSSTGVKIDKADKLRCLISVALLAFVSVELVSVGLEDVETAATGQDMATMARHAVHRRARMEGRKVRVSPSRCEEKSCNRSDFEFRLTPASSDAQFRRMKALLRP